MRARGIPALKSPLSPHPPPCFMRGNYFIHGHDDMIDTLLL